MLEEMLNKYKRFLEIAIAMEKVKKKRSSCKSSKISRRKSFGCIGW
jgi:hypothetical protein